MTTVRILLLAWGVICVLFLCYAVLHSMPPIKNFTTTMAFQAYEEKHLESMNEAERAAYEWSKDIVQANDQRSSRVMVEKQKVIFYLSIITAILSFLLAYYLPQLAK